ncbi:unnamed protein product [Owenia fusiformis]|uniref:Uncharacterized protein n=1 Tax=Owenia fusiformis TaxID=6347 RepID=A0A8J1Y044_OWEFU|nr:unnamed protein product [Owenia fusiformis]
MRKCHKYEYALLVIFILGIIGVISLVVVLKLDLDRKKVEEKVVRTDDADKETEKFVSASEEKAYRYASIAADAGPCANAGIHAMASKGGSAVDGAIITLLCTGLYNPQSMGIGGGFFMTVYQKDTGKTVSIDSREVAPLAATEDMYLSNPTESRTGGKAIAVPGELKGYKKAHDLYGKMAWKDLFEPVIKMAEDGIVISATLGSVLKRSEEAVKADPGLRALYVNNGTGELYKEGDTIKMPKLARTLRTVANEGIESMYSKAGTLAADVVADINEAGGIITLDDLDQYTVTTKEPLNITLGDDSVVYSTPPPGSGAVMELIVNILDGYGFNEDSMNTKNSALTYHRIIEAFKFGFAKRTELGDEDFIEISDLLANMTSRSYADAIRSRISDNTTHDTLYYGPTYYDQIKTGTAHISVVGANGDAVSVTSTINLYFGSKVKGSRTGIVFNDEMDDFSTSNLTNAFGIRPSPANKIVPKKRPLSSMCPTIVVNKDGDVELVVGAAGGTRITTASALVLIRSLMIGEGIKEAIDAPRLHHQLLPKEVQMEANFSKRDKEELEKLGHEFKVSTGISVVQAVLRGKDGKLYANSDYRKGGYTDGY